MHEVKKGSVVQTIYFLYAFLTKRSFGVTCGDALRVFASD